MAQTTIYLPDELRDALRRRPAVNVSRVCQDALWRALDEADGHDDLRRRLSLAEPSGWPLEL